MFVQQKMKLKSLEILIRVDKTVYSNMSMGKTFR